MAFMIGFIIVIVFFACLFWVLGLMIEGFVIWGFIINAIVKWFKRDIDQRNQTRPDNVTNQTSYIDPDLSIPFTATTESIIAQNIKKNKKRKTQYLAACREAEITGTKPPSNPIMLPITKDEIEKLRSSQWPKPPTSPQKNSMMMNLILFICFVGLLAAGFFYMHI